MDLLTGLSICAGIVSHEDWDLSGRGVKDAERHRKKIDKSIRDNVKDVISEESIITKKKGRKVRIPVKGLKDFRFVYGKHGNGAGAGQGDGKSGDIVDRRPKDDGTGGPGSSKGSDYMETEVDIDYLINIMFEDLGLPWIEEKTKKEHLVPKGWKFESISKKGILPRLHKRRTFIEALKRTALYVREVMDETGCDEDEANRAIIHTQGDIDEAISIIRDGKTNGTENGIYIEDDDLRYKQIEEDVEVHSNAVVIAMMDVSYSMTKEKKYLARSMLFWMVEFLKKMYSNVDIKFIQHTTQAEIVDEETFFKKGTVGGTLCYTAFEKANYLIETEYPVDEWNIYCVYISDGEDFEPDRTMTTIQEMLDKKINMLSYCEIDLGQQHQMSHRVLLNHMKRKWKFKKRSELGTEFYKNEEQRFLLSVIKNKDHIWPCLKHQLFQPVNK